MTRKQRGPSQPAARKSGHLTVRPEGEGADVRQLFDEHDSRVGSTRVLSGAVVHVLAILALIVIARLIPERVYESVLPDRLSNDIVWLADPGPGGGGGGGNESPEPPKPAELPGEEKITVPAAEPPEPTPEPVPEPPPVFEPITIPALTMASASEISSGDISDVRPPDTDSRGSGTGTGAGPGRGSGLGPGEGGNTGGGVYQPGNGVTLPTVVREIKPQYTSEAMRAKVQGTVLLQAVVLADGTVGPVEVVKSLDSAFGLDEEAIKAAKRWLFRPGTRFGEPVNVLVTIQLDFTLR